MGDVGTCRGRGYGFWRFSILQGHPTDHFGKYLFGKPLIPSDFLEKIVTSNFRDMKNLMSVVFVLLKMSFWSPKKGQLSFLEDDKA